MDNPFLKYNEKYKTEYLSSICSLNSAVMAKLPLKGIDDEIREKECLDIFSTELFIEEIKFMASVYNVDISMYDDKSLPLWLSKGLNSNNVLIKQLANSIARKFGYRLGLILLMLKLGEKENREARKNWDDRMWQYWASLDTVILVGGLASDILGRKLKEGIYSIFDKANVEPYRINLFENASHIGIMGCAQKMMKDNTISLVFDLGHTNTKRGIVKKEDNRIVQFTALDSFESKYMGIDYESDEERFKDAVNLHREIVRFVSETYKNEMKSQDLSKEIIISIANYTCRGELNSVRGAYSKLSLLSDDYEQLLNEELSSEIREKVSVKLIHDGTATALYFSDIKNSVCLSLGTSFGVGFPDIEIK